MKTTAQRLTLEQAIILSGITGTIVCPPEEFYADATKRVQSEMGDYTITVDAENIQHEGNAEMVRSLYMADARAIIPVDWAALDAADAAEAAANDDAVITQEEIAEGNLAVGATLSLVQ